MKIKILLLCTMAAVAMALVGCARGTKSPSTRPVKPGMVFVKGGTFVMGSEEGDSDEKPLHKVTLSNFYISKYEVTQAEWMAVMGTTVAEQRDKADPSLELYGEGDNYPMYYVNWKEAHEYITKLNLKTSKK